MTNEYTIILYSQYGNWTATAPFESRQAAERHADSYLRLPEKDYMVGLTFLTVVLPMFPKDKELGDYIEPTQEDAT